MRIRINPNARRNVSERSSADVKELPVFNFLRGGKSLVGAANQADRYSKKFRSDVVERLLSCQTTVTQVCRDLSISELDVQQWIAGFVDDRLRANVGSQPHLPLQPSQDGSQTIVDEDQAGIVIEGTTVPKSD